MRSRWLLSLALLATVALTVLASAAATTAPGVTVVVRVMVTDRGMKMSQYTAQRGLTVYFVVRNRGTKPCSAYFGEHRTGPIAPGRQRAFSASLGVRGSYPFRVLVSPTRKRYKVAFRVV